MNRSGDVEGLNELELVGGKLFGNIFTTRAIVRIDPKSGCIDGIADLSVLWQAMNPEERAAIALRKASSMASPMMPRLTCST
jgi:glutamine cyclotransferase